MGRITVLLVFWWTWIGDLCVIATLPIVCWLNITSCKASTRCRFGPDALPTTRSCDCVILGDSCHVNTPHLLSESFLTEALAIPDRPQLRRHRSVPSIFILVNTWRLFIWPFGWLVWHMKWNRLAASPFKFRLYFGSDLTKILII